MPVKPAELGREISYPFHNAQLRCTLKYGLKKQGSRYGLEHICLEVLQTVGTHYIELSRKLC